ncbi:MAG: TerB family tellurite resistance protein [Spirulinaceae cyanobacterium]
MSKNAKTKQLLKILIGAAWIDGTIQAEEREYLHQMATEKGVAEDPQIKPLLSEIKQVKPSECYSWLKEYLGNNPTEEDYQQLFEYLSALIYSDGDVDTEEAKLLNRLQLLEAENKSPKSGVDKFLRAVQKLYRKAVVNDQ